LKGQASSRVCENNLTREGIKRRIAHKGKKKVRKESKTERGKGEVVGGDGRAVYFGRVGRRGGAGQTVVSAPSKTAERDVKRGRSTERVRCPKVVI